MKHRVKKFLALVCMSVTVCSCGFTTDDAERLQRAQEAFDAGDYRAAVIDTKTLLRSEPDNVLGRVLLGRASLAMGDSGTALKEIERAIELGAAREHLLVTLAQALVAESEYSRLLVEIDPEQATSVADRRYLLRSRGQAELGLNNLESARSHFREVLSLDSSDMESMLGIAATHMLDGDFLIARTVVDEALAVDDSSAAALLMSGDVFQRMAEPTSALMSYEQALEWARKDGNRDAQLRALSGAAEMHFLLDDLPSAKLVSDELDQFARDTVPARLVRSRIAYREDRWDEALRDLQTVLSVDPENPAAQLLTGAVQLQQGNLRQAEVLLAAVVAVDRDNHNAGLLLGETKLRLGKPEVVDKVLAPLLERGIPEALLLAARASMAIGDLDGAIDYLRQRAAGADSDEAKLDLAAAYALAGSKDEIIEWLAKVEDGNADVQKRIDLIDLLTVVVDEGPQESLPRMDELLNRYPDDAGMHVLAGSLLRAAGEVERARDSYESAARLDASNPAGLAGLGSLAIEAGDIEEARRLFIEATKLASTDSDMLATVAILSARLDDADEARRWAERAMSVADDHALALDLVGQLDQEAGDHQEALKSHKKAVRAAPENLSYRLNLARAQWSLNQRDSAQATAKRSLAIDPEHLPTVEFLVRSQLQENDLDGALATATAISTRRYDDPTALALLGEARAANGDFDGAIEAYDRAMRLSGDVDVALELSQLRSMTGRSDAHTSLETYLRDEPDDDNVRVALAATYLAQGKHTEAIGQYEYLLSADPDNAITLNNLAWSYMQIGDERAQATAARAYELLPTDSSVADTYAWVLINTGSPNKGVTILQGVMASGEVGPDHRYHLAEGLAAIGELGAAREELELVLREDEEFLGRAGAEALLARLRHGE